MIQYLKQLFCSHRLVKALRFRDWRESILTGVRCEKCGKTMLLTVSLTSNPCHHAEEKEHDDETVCKKRAYKRKKDAVTMLNLRKNEKSGSKPCRVYSCHLCGGWHLTSKPRR